MDELGGPTDLQPLPGRLGARDGHAVPVDASRSPRTSAARATAWSSPGPSASSRPAKSARSSARSLTSCRRILEAAGVQAPTMHQRREAEADRRHEPGLYASTTRKRRRQHKTQYFEMFANRGIYHDGWVANTTPMMLPWIGGRATASFRPRLQVGALPHQRGFLRSEQPRGQRTGEAQGTAGPLLAARRRNTTSIRSRTAG